MTPNHVKTALAIVLSSSVLAACGEDTSQKDLMYIIYGAEDGAKGAFLLPLSTDAVTLTKKTSDTYVLQGEAKAKIRMGFGGQQDVTAKIDLSTRRVGSCQFVIDKHLEVTDGKNTLDATLIANIDFSKAVHARIEKIKKERGEFSFTKIDGAESRCFIKTAMSEVGRPKKESEEPANCEDFFVNSSSGADIRERFIAFKSAQCK